VKILWAADVLVYPGLPGMSTTQQGAKQRSPRHSIGRGFVEARQGGDPESSKGTPDNHLAGASGYEPVQKSKQQKAPDTNL